MAHDVFISYSIKDTATGNAVCKALESKGVHCWIAPRDVTPGAEWSQCIIEAIERSRIMVLVFSADANDSPQIRREVERAANRGISILTLRIADVVPCKALEYFIANVQWLDAVTPPLETHLKNLAGTVKLLLAGKPPREASPLPAPVSPQTTPSPTKSALPPPEIAPSSPIAAPSVSSVGRIFGVLFSPKPTFESIVRRPSWLAPVVLGCVFFMAVVAVFTQRGGWPSFFEKQAASSSRMQKMSAEDRERTMQAQVKFAPTFGYIEGVIIPPVGALVVAGVLMLIFNLSIGTRINFKTSLGIVSFAWVPWLIHGALSVLILYLRDPSTVDLQNIVASNPGALLSDDTSKWLVALLGSIDIFAIWTMILLAIGFSATDSKKLSFGKSLVLVIIPWILFTVMKVGIVAAVS
jgi:hypothetical protein